MEQGSLFKLLRPATLMESESIHLSEIIENILKRLLFRAFSIITEASVADWIS